MQAGSRFSRETVGPTSGCLGEGSQATRADVQTDCVTGKGDRGASHIGLEGAVLFRGALGPRGGNVARDGATVGSSLVAHVTCSSH